MQLKYMCSYNYSAFMYSVFNPCRYCHQHDKSASEKYQACLSRIPLSNDFCYRISVTPWMRCATKLMHCQSLFPMLPTRRWSDWQLGKKIWFQYLNFKTKCPASDSKMISMLSKNSCMNCPFIWVDTCQALYKEPLKNFEADGDRNWDSEDRHGTELVLLTKWLSPIYKLGFQGR